MPGRILVSTAYLPPIEYISLISHSENAVIELHENYLKQSYRNRCYILSSYGHQILTVPVLLGSLHKVKVRDLRIDYSKRWQQVHLRSINASYGASPYFEFYFESFQIIISRNYEFLFDLNFKLTEAILKMLKLNCNISLSTDFESVDDNKSDFRYSISPKRKSDFLIKDYMHVFNVKDVNKRGLSIIDLIFNIGPEAKDYL